MHTYTEAASAAPGTNPVPLSARYSHKSPTRSVVCGAGALPLGGAGYLVITKPWPAMLRGIYKDDQRYRDTYWSRFPGKFFAGDGANATARATFP